MGTRWRGLLALQNRPTADGRRFKTLSWRTLPLGLKWQRVDAEGHDDSVVVGSLETAGLGTVAEAVEAGWVSAELAAESNLDAKAVGLWGAGEMFDDADPATMPRLAEDVAEMMLMLDKKVTAPSIDAIAVGAVLLVEPGEDEPPSPERMDEMFEEWMETGVEPVFEVLFEEGLVAAATLVVTPAFSEVRPFELLTDGDTAIVAEQTDRTSTAAADTAEMAGDGMLVTCSCQNSRSADGAADPLTHGSLMVASAIRAPASPSTASGARPDRTNRAARTATVSSTELPAPPAPGSASPAISAAGPLELCPIHNAPSAASPSPGSGAGSPHAPIAGNAGSSGLSGRSTHNSPRRSAADAEDSRWPAAADTPSPTGAGGSSGQRTSSGTPESRSGGTTSTRSWSSRTTSAASAGVPSRSSPAGERSTTRTSTTRTASSGAGSVVHATGGLAASLTSPSGYERLLSTLNITASAPLPPLSAFSRPDLDSLEPVVVEDRGEGFLRVFGYVAAKDTCHVGFRNLCVAPPSTATDYAMFHRYIVDTADGVLSVGRITTGHGKVGTGCTCCRGKDDHACSSASLAAAIGHHDQLRTLAYVRAGEDEAGNIWVAGIAVPDLTAQDRAVLGRRMVSGDWREAGGSLELVEILALANSQPGFPLLSASFGPDGRQRSLVAAGAIHPKLTALAATAPGDDDPRLRFARSVADLVVADLVAAGLTAPSDRAGVDLDSLAAAAAVTAATETEHTGAMIALRMSEEDAARLAVEGGEPQAELHLTLAYLGEAADIDQDTRNAIIEACWNAADGWGGNLDAEVFSVSAFNPGDANDRETAIVYGVGGESVETAHADVRAAMDGVFTPPDQHAPWAAHITGAYSDDLGMVETLADRVGPITFDRLRFAFGGEVTDIDLTKPTPGEVDEAASLLGEITAAVNAPVAAGLLRELEAAGVRMQ